MVFERPNGPFSGIPPVDVWRGRLEIDVLRSEEVLKILGSFIVESV